MQIKIDRRRGKIDSGFAHEVLVRRNLMKCIYLFTPQETEKVGNSRQSSSVVNSQGKIFMASHEGSSCLWLFPFPPYDNFKKLRPLCSSRSNKYNNYDKATYILSSNLCIFTCPQADQAYQCKNCVSQIHPPVSGVNFSNNISIPQV